MNENIKEYSKIAKQILTELLNFLFPPVCAGCGEVGQWLCKKCRKRIKIRENQICHVCKSEVGPQVGVHKKCLKKTSLNGVFVLAHYNKLVERMVAEIKYEFRYGYIEEVVRLLAKGLKNQKFIKGINCITAVPLHPARERWRSFNHAQKIGKALAEKLNIPYVELLERVKETKSQVGLGREERLKNVSGAFVVKKAAEHNLGKFKKIAIVDDVYTTGATLEECGKVLKEEGNLKVYGIVSARG